MAAVSTIIAAAAAVIGGISYVKGEEAREEAKKSAQQAATAQRGAQAETAAVNAAQAASERRKQVREERVRRARIMQTSEASGTVGSSGETGGIGGMATQLGSNLGANAGMLQKSVAIGNFNQQAADFSFSSQQSMGESQAFQQLGGLSMSIFSAAGGAGALKGTAPKTDSTTIPMQPGGGY